MPHPYRDKALASAKQKMRAVGGRIPDDEDSDFDEPMPALAEEVNKREAEYAAPAGTDMAVEKREKELSTFNTFKDFRKRARRT